MFITNFDFVTNDISIKLDGYTKNGATFSMSKLKWVLYDNEENMINKGLGF